MIGGIKERTVSNKKPPTAPTPGRPTGFPRAEHRSKKSAFLQNRQEISNLQNDATQPSPTASTSATLPDSIATPASQIADQENTSPDISIHDDISTQNARQVEAMSAEQIEQERRDIVERFGPGIAERLRRAREAQSRQAPVGECGAFLDANIQNLTFFQCSIDSQKTDSPTPSVGASQEPLSNPAVSNLRGSFF